MTVPECPDCRMYTHPPRQYRSVIVTRCPCGWMRMEAIRDADGPASVRVERPREPYRPKRAGER